jgi:hypothetical protein
MSDTFEFEVSQTVTYTAEQVRCRRAYISAPTKEEARALLDTALAKDPSLGSNTNWFVEILVKDECQVHSASIEEIDEDYEDDGNSRWQELLLEWQDEVIE